MFVPELDVCERVSEIVVLVEVPGIERADIHLSWKDGVLTISGVKRQRSESGVRYMCIERSHGPFRRDIAISSPINHRMARAELRDGLMRIHLPKAIEGSAPAAIPIE